MNETAAELDSVKNKVEAEYEAAARSGKLKTSWLRMVAGGHYSLYRKSEHWKQYSKRYDAVMNEQLETYPLSLLMSAAAQVEAKITAGQELRSSDLDVIRQLSDISKNRKYLRLHTEKQQLDKRLKKNADKRAEELHNAVMNSKFTTEDNMELVELKPMRIYDIIDIVGIDTFMKNREKFEDDDRRAVEMLREEEERKRSEMERKINDYLLYQQARQQDA